MEFVASIPRGRQHPPGPKRASPPAQTVALRRSWLALMLVLLAAFLVSQYSFGLRLFFVNDDYILLDATRTATFASLWKRTDLPLDWYRPWSRELHYWVLQRLFGPRPVPYHLINFVLWLGVMGLYAAWVARLGGGRVAAVAAAGVAALALWATPILWVAGAQDLWMLLFTLLFL